MTMKEEPRVKLDTLQPILVDQAVGVEQLVRIIGLGKVLLFALGNGSWLRMIGIEIIIPSFRSVFFES